MKWLENITLNYPKKRMLVSVFAFYNQGGRNQRKPLGQQNWQRVHRYEKWLPKTRAIRTDGPGGWLIP